MNICYLIPHAEPGGGERMVVDLCRRLNRQDFTPYAIIPKSGRLGPMLEAAHTTVAMIPFRRDLVAGYPPGFQWSAFQHLARQMKTWKIDLIHLNDSYLSLMGGALGRMLKVPVCLTAHGNWDAHFFIQDILNQFLIKKIWTPTQAVADAVRRRHIVSADKIKKIPFGIDVNWFSEQDQSKARLALDLPADATVIVRIARFDRVKDFPTFLKSAELIVQQDPTVYFLVVGDVLLDIPSERASYRQEAQQFVSNHPLLRQQVKFLGYQDDVRPMIAAADMLVSSSLSESFGFTLIEAMAMGKPIVSTHVGGPTEIVADGITGFLVPPSDPQKLSDSIMMLVRNPELRKKMGQSARLRVVENFNLNAFVKLMEHEYKNEHTLCRS